MSVVKNLFLAMIFSITKVGDAVLTVVQTVLAGIKALFIFIISFPRVISRLFRFWRESRESHQSTSSLSKKMRIEKPRFVLHRRERGKNYFLKTPFFYKFKFFIFGVIVSFIFTFLPLLAFIFISDLPDPHNINLAAVSKTTKIYDRSGKLLYEVYANQNRTVVELSRVPKHLRQATIAIEDKDFYNHPGFDLRGIARALVSNIQKKDLQGGSTITQQLIKSALLTPEPTIIRKTKEVILAFWAERVYSKDQILELYFNYVPYGGTAWGIQSASEIYFGKNVNDLNLAESSFLAGLPRAPSIYSPLANADAKWQGRQKEVLDAMVREKYITQAEATEAMKTKLQFQKPEVPLKAPHFVMYVRKQLEREFGISDVERGGLSVTTSLDLPLQEEVQTFVKDQVESNAYLNIQNGAALVTNPQNGDILAMVGSQDYFDEERDGNVNITTSSRQPGSTIKIVTYALALSSGFTEATILDDSPLTIQIAGQDPYRPVNYDGKYRGRIPLRLAFANSLNIPAVRVAQKLGVSAIVAMGKKMGITSWDNPDRYGVSITLGGANTTMTDLSTVYGTIANGGKRVDLNPILEVKDVNGRVIYKKRPIGEQVIEEGVAFIIGDILADNNARSASFGINSPLTIPGRRVSVKTGTTDEKRDNWTIGFTKDLVVTTWVGNNDNSPMSPELTSGITGAAPLWNKIMTRLLIDKKEESVTLPGSIVRRNCYGKPAYFVKGTERLVSCSGFGPSMSPSPLIVR